MRKDWTSFNNWDIQLQKIRSKNNMVSLQPDLSRVRNIGQYGINFKVRDDEWREKWNTTISEGAFDYSAPPILIN